jgi:glycosyltransferase involved in cell wall biosynthesis
MKFSIVLIAYNCNELTLLAIKSLKQQKYPANLFEIILVDDGSNPPISIDMAITDGLQFQSYYLPRNEQSSRARARNFGAAKSTYDWLIFMDGDQYANNYLLENYKNNLLINPEAHILSGTRIELTDWQSMLLGKEDNQHFSRAISRQKDIRWQLVEEINKNIIQYKAVWSIFWSHNFLISKNIFIGAEGFDENFIGWGCEDTEFGYRINKLVFSIKIIDNPVYNIFSSESISTEKYKEYLNNVEYFYKKHRVIDVLLFFSFYEKTFFNKKKNYILVDEFKEFNNKLISIIP